MSAVYTDGTFTSLVQRGPKRISLPLQLEGEDAQMIERDYIITAANYSPTMPNYSITDPDNANAYFVEESVPSADGGALTVTRTFAEIPASVNVGTSTAVVLPDSPVVAPNVWGDYTLTQPDTSIERYDIYTAKTVSSDSGVPAFTVTGGTYTLTFSGDTTSNIAHNANAATLNTAFNALTSVSDYLGAVITGDHTNGFDIDFNTYSNVTINTSNITNYVSHTTSISSSGRYQVITINPSSGPILSGTFTLTFNGSTTSSITIQGLSGKATMETDTENALNAATAVGNVGGVDDVTIAGTYVSNDPVRLEIRMTFSANPEITVDASSLTPAPASSQVSTTGVYNEDQSFELISGTATRTVSAAAHGISDSSEIVLKTNTNAYYTTANYSVVGPNDVDLTGGPTDAYMNTTAAYTIIGGLTRANYTPGPVTVPARIQSDFYLPGVTPNIATFADIPVIEEQSTDTELMEAIFAGTGDINYSVDSLERWNGWPIYRQSYTVINAADI